MSAIVGTGVATTQCSRMMKIQDQLITDRSDRSHWAWYFWLSHFFNSSTSTVQNLANLIS